MNTGHKFFVDFTGFNWVKPHIIHQKLFEVDNGGEMCNTGRTMPIWDKVLKRKRVPFNWLKIPCHLVFQNNYQTEDCTGVWQQIRKFS